jgi:hypothetical protein
MFPYGNVTTALALRPMHVLGRVSIELSKVEIRFEDLMVEADVHVGGRALPTVLNSVRNFAEVKFII